MNPTRGDLSEQQKMPSVSVVIPAYNGSALLQGCLQALSAQTYPSNLVEVFVVDNKSEEDISKVVNQFPAVRLLFEGQQGSYAARNRALKEATGTVLAFTDADCAPHADWLERGVAALSQAPMAAMVGGCIKLTYPRGLPRTGPEIYENAHAFRQQWYLEQNQYAATANVFTWRTTFDRVGMFNASLRSRGDAEWGKRVFASGGTQRYAPDAVVDHPARSTWPELMTKHRRVARGRCDVDSVERPYLRHFLGNAFSHLISVVKTPRTVWHDRPSRSALKCLKYSCVLIVINLLHMATWLLAAARLLRKRRGRELERC